MTQPGDQDFTQLDTFLADTMAEVLDTLETVLDPSGRLASLGRRSGQAACATDINHEHQPERIQL